MTSKAKGLVIQNEDGLFLYRDHTWREFDLTPGGNLKEGMIVLFYIFDKEPASTIAKRFATEYDGTVREFDCDNPVAPEAPTKKAPVVSPPEVTAAEPTTHAEVVKVIRHAVRHVSRKPVRIG